MWSNSYRGPGIFWEYLEKIKRVPVSALWTQDFPFIQRNGAVTPPLAPSQKLSFFNGVRCAHFNFVMFANLTDYNRYCPRVEFSKKKQQPSFSFIFQVV